jgi:hypothetical protein
MKSRSDRVRFTRIDERMQREAAWRSLSCTERCAYIELARRYGGPGSNNGQIGYSLRQMAMNLNCSKMTAKRAFDRLQEAGFIVLMKKGAFSFKLRHASEWRLSEYPCDVTGRAATHAYRQQENLEHGVRHDTVRVLSRYCPPEIPPVRVL